MEKEKRPISNEDVDKRLEEIRKALGKLTSIGEDRGINMDDHVIIVGYGINGRNVAKAAKYANIPHCIIELNPDTVKEEYVKGEIIYYGDASQESILQHSGIKKAKAIVVTIADPAAARQITQVSRELNPGLHIMVRTRFVQDMDTLYKLGANEVIPEEFETSVEIFSRLLSKYLVPKEKIDEFVYQIRSHEYEIFRKLASSEPYYSKFSEKAPIPEFHMITLTGASLLVGTTCADCAFSEHNIQLSAVSRDGILHGKISDDFRFMAGDILFFLGTAENFRNLSNDLSFPEST